MPIVFSGIDGFDVNRSYVFPQGILAVITLIGSGVEDGVSMARAKADGVASPFLSAHYLPIGVMLNPKVMELKPQVSAARGLCSL